ncbi:MAG: DNA-3-methyladenine glycosylase [Clostridia bacterium]|nr:DNA-3-methyladenine glycosylase [Clostridia bacterium]
MTAQAVRLTESFYSRSAIELAPLICGKILSVRQPDGSIRSGRITETECYYGEEDTACHAHAGRTKRTETLYSAGGTAYVYLCYGIHDLFNIVTGPAGHPEAVLLRGIEGFPGPGRASKALGITRRMNGLSLIDSEEIWLEDDGYIPVIEENKRIGIGYADVSDQNKLWRFTTTEKP